MKRSVTVLLVLAALAATTPAFADAYDCFPLCAPAAEPAEAPLDLCRHRLVREGLRAEAELRPVKELAGIATDPTGFVLKQVNDHLVRIPPWVHFAINPEGYVRGKVVGLVRSEARKAAGLAEGCAVALSSDLIEEPAGSDNAPAELEDPDYSAST